MDLLRRTFASPVTRVAGVVFALLVLVAIFASLILPASPYTQTTHLLAGPSAHHLLGTDDLGRDTLARLILGTRVSFVGAIEAVAIGLVGGVIPGIASVFLGRWSEFAVMRLIDALMTFPPIVLALGFVAILGEQQNVAMVGIGILFIPLFFRITRAATLGYARSQYVEEAQLLGASKRRVIVSHVARKVVPTIAVTTAQAMAGGLLAVSSLAFLGIGAQPPLPTWGGMLSEDLQFLSNNGWVAIWPGLAIVLSVGSLSIIADGLRDAMGTNGTVVRLVGGRVLTAADLAVPAQAIGPVSPADVMVGDVTEGEVA
jgi:peptide/nickel transport system permease protein